MMVIIITIIHKWSKNLNTSNLTVHEENYKNSKQKMWKDTQHWLWLRKCKLKSSICHNTLTRMSTIFKKYYTVCKFMKQLEFLYIAGKNVKWSIALPKIYQLFKICNLNLLYNPAILWIFTSLEQRHNVHVKTYT